MNDRKGVAVAYIDPEYPGNGGLYGKGTSPVTTYLVPGWMPLIPATALAEETELRMSVEKSWQDTLTDYTALQRRVDACEALLRDLRWRVDDTRTQLMSEGVGGTRLYSCDEWSTPTVNLQRAIDIIDRALLSGDGECADG